MSSIEEVFKGNVPASKEGVIREEPLPKQAEELLEVPLFEEEDRQILMHRQVHFSGSFSAMKEYYSNEEAKGICESIDLARIQELASIEEKLGVDLAAALLSEQDLEKVALFRSMHDELEAIIEKKPDSCEALFAKAILSEEAIEEIAEGKVDQMLTKPDLLLGLLTSDLFRDPLSPGYGTGPALAALLLGKLRYEKATMPLFLLIGTTDFVTETAVLWALHEIGGPAKKFALQKLKGCPLTSDNERAALMLLEFLPDAEIEQAFADLLQSQPNMPDTLKDYVSLHV